MKPTLPDFVLLLLVVVYFACSNNPDPAGDRAYQSVPAATAGNFLRYDSIVRTSAGGQQPAFNIPGFRVGRWPAGFRAGAFQANGRITATGTNAFRFVGANQDTLAVQVGLPEGLPLRLADGADQPGALALRYRNPVDGANEALTLWLGDEMALGYCWQTAARPLSIAEKDRVMLRQLPLRKLPGGNAMAAVVAQAMADGGPVDIKPGAITVFKKEGKNYAAFVQTSLYLSQSDAGEDGRSGYILHAVIVARE